MPLIPALGEGAVSVERDQNGPNILPQEIALPINLLS